MSLDASSASSAAAAAVEAAIQAAAMSNPTLETSAAMQQSIQAALAGSSLSSTKYSAATAVEAAIASAQAAAMGGAASSASAAVEAAFANAQAAANAAAALANTPIPAPQGITAAMPAPQPVNPLGTIMQARPARLPSSYQHSRKALALAPDAPKRCGWKGCGVIFPDVESLSDHMRRDHLNLTRTRSRKGEKRDDTKGRPRTPTEKKKPFKCDHDGCEASFSQLAHLTIHNRTHTGEKPYKCDVEGCEAAFAQLGNLTTHHRTHTGERRYKCQVAGCDAAYTSSSSLTKHRRTHNREKGATTSRSKSRNKRRKVVGKGVDEEEEHPEEWEQDEEWEEDEEEQTKLEDALEVIRNT